MVVNVKANWTLTLWFPPESIVPEENRYYSIYEPQIVTSESFMSQRVHRTDFEMSNKNANEI